MGYEALHRRPGTVIELSTTRFKEVLLDDAAILTVRFTVSQHLLTLAIWAIHRLGFKHCLDFSPYPLTVQCRIADSKLSWSQVTSREIAHCLLRFRLPEEQSAGSRHRSGKAKKVFNHRPNVKVYYEKSSLVRNA